MGAASTQPGSEKSSRAQEEELRVLMVSYQAGDARAVEDLVRQLSPRLLRFLGAPPLAGDDEDLLQECWVRIHRSRHTYLPSEPLLPWVFAIARHTRLDGLRRRQRQERREMLVPEVPERIQPPGGAMRQPDLLPLLEELPPAQREVILLLKVSGMSIEEVARATGSTTGAIKQKAHRAYTTLRKRLMEGA